MTIEYLIAPFPDLSGRSGSYEMSAVYLKVSTVQGKVFSKTRATWVARDVRVQC